MDVIDIANFISRRRLVRLTQFFYAELRCITMESFALLQPGLMETLTHMVREQDLATQWRNDVPVLATPVLLWLAELTCMRVIDRRLPAGFMSLGHAHDCRHQAPTPEGRIIRIDAVLLSLVGRAVTFSVTGHDDAGIVLQGTHQRVIVERDRFLERIARRMAGSPGSQQTVEEKNHAADA